MATSAENESQLARPDSTGEGVVRSRDVNVIRRAINARWPISATEIRKAIDTCVAQLSNEDGRVAVAAVKAIVAMEGQNQADDHLTDKNARIDGGQATESVKLYASAAPTEAV